DNFFFLIFSYYKCAKSNNVCCPGTAKRNVDGTFVELKPHLITHLRSMDDNGNLLKLFKSTLKTRAKNENSALKTIYDEESRRHTVAAASYPWSTAESLMCFARRSSLPTLPQTLQGLATRFEDGCLNRFSCCDTMIFQGCISDTEGKLLTAKYKSQLFTNYTKFCLDELCGLSQNYHNIVRQLENGLQPTRNLKSKFIMNSKRIKMATEQYDAGIISSWQFLVKCSYSCTSYEERLRRWALDIEIQDIGNPEIINGEDIIAEPLPEQLVHNDMQEETISTCITCTIETAENNISQYIALPCGHAWICETCVSILNEQYPKRCPMCRADCDTFQRIYYG
ncbi:uncharacterized protein LOC111037750, partial [Myzus persicae]|uniref:uncharacterized protein LOC111037750 n=1 Tax=Myzus persicae TaxID=13164 RepID=UPI000B931227